MQLLLEPYFSKRGPAPRGYGGAPRHARALGLPHGESIRFDQPSPNAASTQFAPPWFCGRPIWTSRKATAGRPNASNP